MNLSLQEQFGQIDIYVFDQILRGNITASMRVLDAGCGYGRNMVYLLREGCEIFAFDGNQEAVAYVQQLSESLDSGLPLTNFTVGQVERMPYPDGFVDFVICNSVLHFARDHDHFHAMVKELWRVLRPGGLLFCRLGSRIGKSFQEAGEGRYLTGDGSVWYLVDEASLMQITETLGGELIDPLKTTVVQNHRCMTTWVLRKSQG